MFRPEEEAAAEQDSEQHHRPGLPPEQGHQRHQGMRPLFNFLPSIQFQDLHTRKYVQTLERRLVEEQLKNRNLERDNQQMKAVMINQQPFRGVAGANNQ